MSTLLGLLWGSPLGKLGSSVAALAVLAMLYGAWHHKVYQAGRAEVQARWDLAKIEQKGRDMDAANAFDAALRKAQTAEVAAATLNRRIEDELLPKLAGADARALALTRLLHAARAAEPRGGSVSQGAGQPGPAPAGGGASSAAEIERLAAEVRSSEAAAWAAGERDGTRLDGLIAEIKPQL